MSEDFNWNPTEDDDHNIVVRHQPAIAVYTNPHDEVVIRQQADGCYEDGFVFITKDNIFQVAERMLALAGYSMNGEEQQPKDTSAAARQPRYRDKKRNGVTPETVTDHNAMPLLLAAE